GVGAILHQAVYQGAALGGACRYQLLGAPIVGQGVGGGSLGHRGRRLGDLESGGAVDSVVAAVLIHDGDGSIVPHIGGICVLNGVLACRNYSLAVLDGDNLGPDLAAGVLDAGSAQLNGWAADLL